MQNTIHPGHADIVHGICWSPSTPPPHPLHTHPGHADVVHGICWSPDGRSLATACEDMFIRVFDVADGEGCCIFSVYPPPLHTHRFCLESSNPCISCLSVCNRDPKFRRIKTPRIPVGAGFADGQADKVAVVMKGEELGVGVGVRASHGTHTHAEAPSHARMDVAERDGALCH